MAPFSSTGDAGSEPERVVRRAWLALLDRGWEGLLEHCTEDVVWVSLLAAGRPIQGGDGIRAMYDGVAATGVSHTVVPYRYGRVGDRVIVSADVCVTQGTQRDPDLHVYLVYDLDGDKIARICEYLTPEEALAAAREP